MSFTPSDLIFTKLEIGLRLRLCLFWVKITSGNAFPEMRLFGWSGKFYFPEIEIHWLKKKAFDHWNRFTLLFSLQSVSGKWERERESARALDRDLQAAISPSLIAISSPRSPVRVRDLQSVDPASSLIAISRSGSRSRSTAQSREDRDLAVDRDLGLELELAIPEDLLLARALSLSLSFSGNPLKVK